MRLLDWDGDGKSQRRPNDGLLRAGFFSNAARLQSAFKYRAHMGAGGGDKPMVNDLLSCLGVVNRMHSVYSGFAQRVSACHIECSAVENRDRIVLSVDRSSGNRKIFKTNFSKIKMNAFG